MDFGKGEVVPVGDLLEEIIALTPQDAEALGCVGEVERARDIVGRGARAHRQLAIYRAAIGQGAAKRDALKAVVDWLIEETAKDL